jgi:hypothetical protein
MRNRRKIMNDTEKLIVGFVSKYRYAKLQVDLSNKYRKIYEDTLPEDLKKLHMIQGIKEISLFSTHHTQISTGFERIVIGDYGAFIEFNRTQIVKENICCAPGQEYRYKDEKYKKRVKYYWYTTKDESGCKIYFQQRIVSYADYRPGYYYISPYEILI